MSESQSLDEITNPYWKEHNDNVLYQNMDEKKETCNCSQWGRNLRKLWRSCIYKISLSCNCMKEPDDILLNEDMDLL
jgi:hypothetical protein